MEQLDYILQKLDDMDLRYNKNFHDIITQTTKTNGRVLNLESKVEKIETRELKNSEIISSLKTTENLNKGRDKTIWIVMVTLASIVVIVIEHLISKT